MKRYTDRVVDYRDSEKLELALQENKFSCYFDNVGDALLDRVLENIEIGGRVALCGATSNYSAYSGRGILKTMKLIEKRVRMEGLTFFGMIPKMHESRHALTQFFGSTRAWNYTQR